MIAPTNFSKNSLHLVPNLQKSIRPQKKTSKHSTRNLGESMCTYLRLQLSCLKMGKVYHLL
jgi:hypothetical protein